MWYWIRKKLHDRTLFLSRLILVSFFGHVSVFILLAAVCCFSTHNVHRIAMNCRPSKAVQFVFKPLAVQRAVVPVQKKKTSTHKTSVQQAKPTQGKNAEKSMKKPVVKKGARVVPMKETKKPTIATTTSIKKEAKKPTVAPKEDNKKSVPVSEKKTVTKSNSPAQPTVQSLEKQSISDLSNQEKNQPIMSDMPSEVETVTIGRHERALLQLQEQVYAAINTQWKTPPSVRKGIECEIAFSIDQKGCPQLVKIVRSSGVLIYDIAARNAVLESLFPPSAYLKEFQILFRS